MPRFKRILIIAEKPKAAEKIASALGYNKEVKEMNYRGVKYYKIRDGSTLIYVVYALGHLYTLEELDPKFFKRYPVYTLYWRLNTQNSKRKRSIRNIIKLINKLSLEADEIVNACDYDIEGSTIGYNVIRFSNKKHDYNVSRMKFSSLTDKEVRKAYVERRPGIDLNYSMAGIVRHLIDFIWGVNLTRLLTYMAESASGFHSLISIGRVQGPTLRYIVNREREINLFIPEPYWTLTVNAVTDTGGIIVFDYINNPIYIKRDAFKLKKSIEKYPVGEIVDIKEGKRKYKPPTPFNLTDLQSEAYTNFGFKPSKTLAIAEQLYLEALITYPRTSSQKYPEGINHFEILNSLSKIGDYSQYIKKILSFNPRLKPREGKKTDPAHPAIYPTGEIPNRGLPPDMKKLYDLILRRYLSTFYPPVIIRTMKITLKIDSHLFTANGRTIMDRGWLDVYGMYTNIGENTLPPLKIDDKINIESVLITEKYTSPPRRYTQKSLLLKMEKDGIGTKATRSQIIDTLYQRNYIKGESIEPTELGMGLVEILENQIPKIISISMTREMERHLENILTNTSTSKKVLIDAIESVSDIIMDVVEKSELGEQLDTMSKTVRYNKRILGKCPVCSDGVIYILRSKRTKKRFAGCSNFPKCNASMPLPQTGKIYKAGTCKHCGWPRVRVNINTRHFVSCINLSCPSRSK